jgi:hypothetical protein
VPNFIASRCERLRANTDNRQLTTDNFHSGASISVRRRGVQPEAAGFRSRLTLTVAFIVGSHYLHQRALKWSALGGPRRGAHKPRNAFLLGLRTGSYPRSLRPRLTKPPRRKPRRYTSPKDAMDIWGHISSSTLLMKGTESWAPDPEKSGRVSSIPDRRTVVIGDAGQ